MKKKKKKRPVCRASLYIYDIGGKKHNARGLSLDFFFFGLFPTFVNKEERPLPHKTTHLTEKLNKSNALNLE